MEIFLVEKMATQSNTPKIENLYLGEYLLDDFVFQNENYSIRKGYSQKTKKNFLLKFTTNLSQFQREIELCNILESQLFVKCTHAYRDDSRNFHCLAFPWEEGTFLSDCPDLKTHEIRSLIISLAKSLHHLHDIGFVYCDLRPENVVWIENSWKLINLGNVNEVGDTVPMASLSPQIANKVKKSKLWKTFVKIEFGLDSYLLGILLSELISESSTAELDERSKDILRVMMKIRPSMQQVLNHPYCSCL